MVQFVISMTRDQKRFVLLLIDILTVPVALVLAFSVLYSALWPAGPLGRGWVLAPVLMMLALVGSLSLRLPSVRLKDFDVAAMSRSAALSVGLASASTLIAWLAGLAVPFGLHVVFGMIYLTLSVSLRLVLLQGLTFAYRKSEAVTRVAIYGAGRTGLALARALRSRSDILPLAFLDDSATLRGMTVGGLPVYAGIDVDAIAARYRLGRVILAMPSQSASRITSISRRIEALGLEVMTVPAFAQLVGGEDLTALLTESRTHSLLRREPARHDTSGLRRAYSGSAILISGAGGSIGSELCRQVLRSRPARLVLLEMSEAALYTIDLEVRLLAEASGTQIVPVLGSAGDGVLLDRVMQEYEIDVVLHAAAYKHVPIVEHNARVGVLNNVLATATLAQKSQEHRVKRFVLVSTDKAVRPSSVMGATKRMAELVVQDIASRSRTTVFSIVRFGNVLGSSGSVVPLFQEQIARGGPVTLTHRDVTRYFMTIQEAAGLVLLAGSFARGGEVFVLDMGEPIRIEEIARRLIRAAGYTVRDEDNPEGDIEIQITGMRRGEKLHEELTERQGAVMTSHPKIIAVHENLLSQIEVATVLRDLREATDSDDPARLVALIERWVAGCRLEPAGSGQEAGGPALAPRGPAEACRPSVVQPLPSRLPPG